MEVHRGQRRLWECDEGAGCDEAILLKAAQHCLKQCKRCGSNKGKTAEVKVEHGLGIKLDQRLKITDCSLNLIEGIAAAQAYDEIELMLLGHLNERSVAYR
jgi:hypothetical protein